MQNVSTVELILEKFREQALADLDRLTQTIKQRDGHRLAQIAHGLKGAASIMSAEALTNVAARLEQLGRQGAVDEAAECLSELQAEIRRCIQYIERARINLVEANKPKAP